MKKFFTRMTIALALGAMVSFAGCGKDYDDDITRLEKRIADNKTTIENALASQLTEINNHIATVETALKGQISTEDQKVLTTLRAELEALKKALEDKINELAKSGISREQLNSEISNLWNSFSNALDALEARVEALELWKDEVDEKLELLFGRIQSIVYVPDYEDGKTTLTGGLDPNTGNTLLEPLQPISLTFQVTPWELAEELIDAYDNEELELYLDVNQTQTRSPWYMDGFDVTSATLGDRNGDYHDSGFITVTGTINHGQINLATLLEPTNAFGVSLEIHRGSGGLEVEIAEIAERTDEFLQTDYIPIYKNIQPLTLASVGFTAGYSGNGDPLRSGTEVRTSYSTTFDLGYNTWITPADHLSVPLSSGKLTSWNGLAAWDGTGGLKVTAAGQQIDAKLTSMGLNPAKIKIVPVIQRQWGNYQMPIVGTWMPGTSTTITTDFKLEFDAAGNLVPKAGQENTVFTACRLIVNLQVYYTDYENNDILISNNNYVCLKF